MNNNFLDTAILEDYLDGKLAPKDMHFVERLSLEDPFVAEALEGLRQSPARRQHLSLLQKQLQERIQAAPANKKRWRIGTHRLSIAATAAVLFITVSIVYMMRESDRKAQEVAATGKSVEVNLTPLSIDSITKDQPVIAQQDVTKDVQDNTGYSEREAMKRRQEALREAVETRQLAKSQEKQRTVADALRARQAHASVDGVVTGNVISAETGQPVGGAVIRDSKKAVLAMTNKAGQFTIRADSNQRVEVDGTGYQAREIVVKDKEVRNITLTPDDLTGHNLGTNAELKRSTVAANPNAGKIIMPVDGWGEYEKYLSQANKLKSAPKNDSVILEFVIDKDGTPGKFKVVKSIDAAHDAEAKRLLSEGPKWVYNGTNTAVRYAVKF